MRRATLLTLTLIFLMSIFSLNSLSQTPPDTTGLKKLIQYLSELEFQVALTKYVEELTLKYGVENLPREKYLVTLMRLVNNEMRKRIKNPRAASEKYFNALKNQLDELQALKRRMKAAGISELDSYINELEARLKYTIRVGVVDYKKKKVFEDALQLLYVAEEMIKMDQLREPGQLSRKITSSKEKLLNAFGEVGDLRNIPIESRPTIFNLYEEWKKTETYKFDARLLDVKIARSNLIKSGSLQEIQRMFNNQLRTAYASFNYYDYDLCDRLLEDLVETYAPVGVRDFEDVYFYWAESNFALNRLMRAEDLYLHLIQEYPNTAYLSNAYARLVQISFKLKNYPDLVKYFSSYQNIASPTEKNYYDIFFIAALALYHQSDFNRAVDILLSFPENSEYYYMAQYLTGSIYAAGQNYSRAQEVFESLVQNRKTPVGIRNRALYKLALISYENGSYLAAIEYLSFIPETYPRYDKVLNALAWSFFMLEQTRTADVNQRNYAQAIHFAQRLVDEYYASEFRMEAESLLAYIYQLQNKPSMALDLYKEVYESKAKEKNFRAFLEERDRLESLYANAKQLEEKALRENNVQAYVRATDVADALEKKLYEMNLAELSPVGTRVAKEVQQVISQLDELYRMKEKAKADGNKIALAKIDSLILKLSVVLERFPDKYLRGSTTFNWFDAYPITRKVAEYQFRSTKIRHLRKSIQDELNTIDTRISLMRRQVEREKFQGNYKSVVQLEQKITRLLELRKKYDQLYASTYQLTPGEPYPDFNRWGDFGAFGIIDVNFGQRNRIQTRMAEVARIYNAVTDMLNKRRQVVEDKLKKIEAEIRFMTMKARLEERVRLRAERERSFRETYFDQRTSEFEEK